MENETAAVTRQADPVPDAVMRQFLEAAEASLRASWAVADVANPLPPQVPQDPNPKQACVESIQALDAALKAAFCGDGSDAVIGYAMVTKSLAQKALGMRAAGLMGPDVRAYMPHRA